MGVTGMGAATSGVMVKPHLGFKSEVIVWVSAQSANLWAPVPLQSEATLHRLTLLLKHSDIKSRAHRLCTCTVDVVQSVYK